MTSKIGYTLFRPGQEPVRGVAEFKSLTGGQFHAVIDPLLGEGKRLEHVAVLHEGKRADMFVDENSAGEDPLNDAATAIYRHYWLSTHPGDRAEDQPAIYGNAVLFDQRIWS